uniref:Activin_recp domain-containing protein n=1 Tax=Syphacia muris TaxID=451379 RepID=A0A0N5ASE3_9BILA
MKVCVIVNIYNFVVIILVFLLFYAYFYYCYHIGYNVIRGCASSVFRHGRVPLGQTEQYKVDASCNDVKAYKLLPLHLARFASNRTVKLCWCVGRLCNDYPSTPRSSVRSLHSFYSVNLCYILVILLLLCIIS